MYFFKLQTEENESKFKKNNNKLFKILDVPSAGQSADWLRKPLKNYYTDHRITEPV